MPEQDIFPVSLNGIKATLIRRGSNLILVDTGLNPEHAETILDYARSIKMPLEEHGEICVITHNHRDHVGGLKALASKCHFKVAAHMDEADAIEATTGIRVEIRLKDGEALPSHREIRLIHVPGHTVGNTCVYVADERLLISGDTLNTSEGGELNPPPDRFNVDTAMAHRELRRLTELDFDRIIVSHGPDVEKGGKRRLGELLARLKV